MSQDFGLPAPGAHANAPHRAPARTLIVIEAAGEQIARLFDSGRRQVAEFDASTEEVAVMLKGLAPAKTAAAADWDAALASHNAAERAAAEVYTLDV